MESLDQMLTSRVLSQQQEEMAEVLDLRTWTRENRDERMKSARVLAERIADQGIEFVKELLEEEMDGKPLMYWVLMGALITGEIELLETMEGEYKITPDEALGDMPVEPDWLIKQIRSRYHEAGKMQAKISERFAQDDAAEV